ncbi:molecular chaperone [Martelella alba]|uniref:Molecular chaperone n=1 Tax=Martelella alba TaxID=2590451 RepID=A0ABY2SLN4_9HYPH|nr:molecular chaperone [Martelella alba]TKI06683.1 molecular chaperone [Martelella alba]
MFIGFDYGTANCSVAIMEGERPRLLPLEGTSPYMASMLCAPTREAISEYLHRFWQIPPGSNENQQLLRRAIRANHDDDIIVTEQSLQFGQSALANYIADPEDVYFVKSPKSFLGANGLKPQQIALFEDLVCAMMSHIKRRAEAELNTPITHAMVGRPINFQGTGGEESNRQAQGILQRAATRAGFADVAFQFEPVAAGLDFEATLSEEKIVLVVDIGGGTTDCSLLLMGPRWLEQRDRSHSLLGHSGVRVGGNDLDIMLAFKHLTPSLGMGGISAKGLALPALPFWQAVAINDIPAQSDFYAAANARFLQQLVNDAASPDQVRCLLQVYQQRLSHRLVRCAEECKITLSEAANAVASLNFIHQGMAVAISQTELEEAIAQPLTRIRQQVDDVLAQSGAVRPDVVYLTGGSARSPLLRAAIRQSLPGIPLTGGDDFGSVTAGLARWARRQFS